MNKTYMTQSYGEIQLTTATINRNFRIKVNGMFNGEMRTGYKLIVSAIEKKQTIIRPAYYSGRGIFTTIMNHTGDVHVLLNAANIKFYNYNDAPRGSVTGEVYKLTHIEY